MKLSQRKRNAAYTAIHHAIMDCRIALAKDGLSITHDAKVAQLETDIWRRLLKALGVTEAA